MYGDTEFSPGDVLTPTKVKDKPCVSYDAKDGDFYALVMIGTNVYPFTLELQWLNSFGTMKICSRQE